MLFLILDLELKAQILNIINYNWEKETVFFRQKKIKEIKEYRLSCDDSIKQKVFFSGQKINKKGASVYNYNKEGHVEFKYDEKGFVNKIYSFDKYDTTITYYKYFIDSIVIEERKEEALNKKDIIYRKGKNIYKRITKSYFQGSISGSELNVLCDKKGNIVKAWNEEGCRNIEYNKANKIIKDYGFENGRGKIEYESVFIYKDGKLLEENISINNKLEKYIKYIFENNLMKYKMTYNNKGKCISKYEFEYEFW